MKLDELDQIMRTLSGHKDNKKQLRAVAHWLKKVKDSKGQKYISYNDEELPTLIKLSELKLITIQEGSSDEKIGTVHIELTEDGKELYHEFFQTGYFLKG
jgi:hypothetical protein